MKEKKDIEALRVEQWRPPQTAHMKTLQADWGSPLCMPVDHNDVPVALAQLLGTPCAWESCFHLGATRGRKPRRHPWGGLKAQAMIYYRGLKNYLYYFGGSLI